MQHPAAPPKDDSKPIALSPELFKKRSPLPRLGPVDAPPPGSTKQLIEMGPSHPAMHGTVKITLIADGEKVERMDTDVGYLHRGFEKSAENATWTMVFPYTDRLNYLSPFINNAGYAMAVEKLMGLTVPPRAKLCRMIASEISRMADHCTCVGASTMELAAFTGMLYLIEARDLLWDLTEELCGARLTVSYVRLGGVAQDLPPGFKNSVRTKLDRVMQLMDDTESLLNRNQIFLGRMRGVGTMTKEEAVEWGWTGPCLRSTGVPYDVRVAHPYDYYDKVKFEVPVGIVGDNFDRYLVRMKELRESRNIILQCLDMIDDTPPDLVVGDARVALPPKERVHSAIEELMNHFKIIIDGVTVPAGEAYSYVEGANGELGYYVVSTGGGKPWKIRVRPPCWPIVSSMPRMVEGAMLADIVPTFGSVNMIGGECDR
ncbi:MAG: NADH-quinone oxidoreductase subunit D [Deltaproteobacteria bacterium]|nr:NADH-quinone oxidoreductase subunit D [Deltaproteobacteria bacterium]